MFVMCSKSYMPNLQCWSFNSHSSYNTLNISAENAFLLVIFPLAQLQAVETLCAILNNLLNLFLQVARVARMTASFAFGPRGVLMVPYRAFDCVHLRIYSPKAQSTYYLTEFYWKNCGFLTNDPSKQPEYWLGGTA
jgi:hypothetical protein